MNKLDGVLHVRFAKEVTIFYFDPEDVVKSPLAPPSPPGDEDDVEGGPALGTAEGKDDEVVVQDVVVQKKL